MIQYCDLDRQNRGPLKLGIDDWPNAKCSIFSMASTEGSRCGCVQGINPNILERKLTETVFPAFLRPEKQFPKYKDVIHFNSSKKEN